MCLLAHCLGAWEWVAAQAALARTGGGGGAGTPVSVAMAASLELSAASTLPSCGGSCEAGGVAPAARGDKENGLAAAAAGAPAGAAACCGGRGGVGAAPTPAASCGGASPTSEQLQHTPGSGTASEATAAAEVLRQLVAAWFGRDGGGSLPPPAGLGSPLLALSEARVAALCAMMEPDCAQTPTALQTLDTSNLNSVVGAPPNPEPLPLGLACALPAHSLAGGCLPPRVHPPPWAVFHARCLPLDASSLNASAPCGHCLWCARCCCRRAAPISPISPPHRSPGSGSRRSPPAEGTAPQLV